MVGIDIISIIPIVVLCICLIGVVFSLFMLRRNNQVFRERIKVNAKIFEKDKSNNFIWSNKISQLLVEMDSVATYNQMMHQFWKKPNSFYKEFLKNLEKEKEARNG